MSISRRAALATGAAAITTAAITAPLAIKAGNVQAALAGDPLLAMEREWLAYRGYIYNYPDDSDAALAPLYDRLNEMEETVYRTPAKTLTGVATKLRLWAWNCTGISDPHPYGEPWWRGDLATMYADERGFALVMRDLERLSGGLPS